MLVITDILDTKSFFYTLKDPVEEKTTTHCNHIVKFVDINVSSKSITATKTMFLTVEGTEEKKRSLTREIWRKEQF